MSPPSRERRRRCATAGPPPSSSTGPASAASALPASCSGWPRSKRRARVRPPTRRDIEAALRAHLCRCTGWQSIVEAACSALGVDGAPGPLAGHPRNPVLAAWRAQLEGPAFQTSGPDVVLGGGGFADDAAPPGALVQLGADAPLAPSLRAARAGSGRVQGRNSTVPLSHPVEVPEGDWALTLQTTWVEPAYVEPDASWCRPGQTPGLAAGQRRRVRREASEPGALPGPGAGRGDRGRRPRPVAARGRGAARAQAAASGRGAARRRYRCRARRPHRTGRGRPGPAGGAGAGALPRRGGRGGRRRRPTRVARPARRGLGRGARGAGRRSTPPASPRGAVPPTSPCPVRAVPASSSSSATARVAASRSTSGPARSSVR